MEEYVVHATATQGFIISYIHRNFYTDCWAKRKKLNNYVWTDC